MIFGMPTRSTGCLWLCCHWLVTQRKIDFLSLVRADWRSQWSFLLCWKACHHIAGADVSPSRTDIVGAGRAGALFDRARV
jgi:hypothetical protein